ncbi:MAG: twin-arginine translocase subunit TatC [Planctomycetota bacterium]|nr:twin-arginine translocase subunit TatC [Planctomycetota bacterium]
MAESPPSDDLFADSTMTFGEHLEELRHCLVRSLLALLVGTVCGLAFSDWVVRVVNGPLEQSLQGYYQSTAVVRYEAFLREREAEGKTSPYTLGQVEDFVDRQHYIYRMYFVHPAAVRTELGLTDLGNSPSVSASPQPVPPVAAEAAEVPVSADKLLSASDLVPLFVWRPMDDDERMSVKSLSPTEAFMIWLKAAVVSGFVLASPAIFYFVWSFIAAGLYPHEKRYVHIFLPFSIGLFLAGALFCFFGVFPTILKFLFAFNADLGIDPDPRISEWLSFAIFLPLGFGLSFQLPLVMLFLERIGILSVDVYLAKWRMAVLVIFVISMMLTPADPISMLAMAMPLSGLYFLGILLCHYFPRRKGFLEE